MLYSFSIRSEYYYRRLRDLREDHDMLQREIAEYLKMHPVQYCRYENGQRDVPTKVLIRLAVLYDTSVDYLLGLTNNPKPYKNLPEESL